MPYSACLRSRSLSITCVVALLSGAPFADMLAQAGTRRAVQAPFAAISLPVSRELSGDRALATVGFVEQYFRLPGNRGYDASIDTLAALLQAAGYVSETSAKPADRLVYRVESRAMAAPAWTPDDASLTIAGRSTPLLSLATNKNMLAINSWSTPAGGVSARVIDVGAGTDAELAARDLKDAIVLVDGNFRAVYLKALQRGARGLLAVQKLPAYNRQEKNTNSIQFTSVARDTTFRGFVILLSRAAHDTLKAALTAGPVQVRAVVATRFESRPDRTVVAEIRGTSRRHERFVYSAHVQEPGANDNASGVGLLAEMARTTAVMLRKGQINPARTLTFLWGDEIRSTDRFIKEDSVRRSGIKWGMSLDMVGENTALTGGTFLIEKMPDPSAVWVRGEDQHSEWGGSPIKTSEIRAYWLNDFVRQRCLDRAAATGWVVKSNPFEGGSDHTPFLNAKIPAVLLWHFTDQFYHTDGDRIQMVSAATLANVGNCALSTGLLLADGSAKVVKAALQELADVAVRELRTQAALSSKAIAGGAKTADERAILETWRDYYLAALDRVPDMAATAGSWDADLRAARAKVTRVATEVLRNF